jgi:hypothetical protein
MQSQLSDSFCDLEASLCWREISDGSRAARDVRTTVTSDQLDRGGFPFNIAPVNPPTRAR